MSRTITALFDTKADADAGAERLRQAGIDVGHVSVHDQDTHKTAGAYSTSKDKGLWASIKNVFVPHEDRHTYEEGIRRGGYLLTADVDDDKTPAAVKALEEANTVDLDAPLAGMAFRRLGLCRTDGGCRRIRRRLDLRSART
ncbi:hypothetical protein [Sphingomonas sp. UYP23]